MTSISSIASSSSSLVSGSSSSLSSDEFIKIMLTELTNQDPLEPTDTSDLVTNMREIQSLLSEQQESRRADLTWAGELVGQSVTVAQMLVTGDEYTALAEAGLSPDVGSGTATGTVSSYRVVDGTVWISMGGYDYPIDNVSSLNPDTTTEAATALSELADRLLGRTVEYETDDGDLASGEVASVSLVDGVVCMVVGGETVPISRLSSVK